MDKMEMKPPPKEDTDTNLTDWRALVRPEFRQSVINRILKSLEVRFPRDTSPQLKQIVEKFEGKNFGTATSKDDYLTKIQRKLINIQVAEQTNALPSASEGGHQSFPDPASQVMQSQLGNERRPLTYLSQVQKQGMSNSMPNTVVPAGVQSASLTSGMPYGASRLDTSVLNGVGDFRSMPQNSVAYLAGKNFPSNNFSDSLRIQGQHTQMSVSQHQQHHQNAQQYIYPNQIAMTNHHANNQPSRIPSHINQIQHKLPHHNLAQTNQLSSYQQPIMSVPCLQPNQSTHQKTHPSFVQSSPDSIHEQNQQHPHLVMRQNLHLRQSIQQEKTVLTQSSISSNQNPQLVGKKPDETDTQQAQHQGTDYYQLNQASSTMPRLSQPQLMLQPQVHPAQLQPQLGLQKNPNSLPKDIYQRLYPSNSFLQPQNENERQKQLYQLQNMPLETSSTSTDSTAPATNTSDVNGNEEIFQKVKIMRETYLPHVVNALKIVIKSFQIAKPEQVERLKKEKSSLESAMKLLQISRSNANGVKFPRNFKNQLAIHERSIISFLQNWNRMQQQGKQELHPTGDHPSQARITQLQHHDSQANNQMQPRNSKFPATLMPPTFVANMQQESFSSLSTHSPGQVLQPSMVNTLQPSSTTGLIHGNGPSLLQQGVVGSPQKTSENASQDQRFNIFSHNDRMTMQSTIDSMQPNSSILGYKQMKREEQKYLQSQKDQYQNHLTSHQVIQEKDQKMIQQNHHQQQIKPQQPPQSCQRQIPPPSQVNEVKGKLGMNVKSAMLQQHNVFPVSSPQSLHVASPQISQNSSPLTDQQSTITSQSKGGTPLQSSNSPLITPSPSTPVTPALPGENEKHSCISPHSNAAYSGQRQTGSSVIPSLVIGTPGISASPLLAESTSQEKDMGTVCTVTSENQNTIELPMQRLINAVKSVSQNALNTSANDISSVVSLVDRCKGSAGHGSKAHLGDDLPTTAKLLSLEDGAVLKKKIKRTSSATDFDIILSDDRVNDSFSLFNSLEIPDLESTATSRAKRVKCEVVHPLLEEIKEINQQLINTVVDINENDISFVAAVPEDGQGTVVKCSFSALALHQESEFELPDLAVCLLVPENYPNSSPVLLDKMPPEMSKKAKDVLIKARMAFNRSLRCLSQPMTLGEMVRTWDASARALVTEYAEQNGGGTFSSRYGAWQNCISIN